MAVSYSSNVVTVNGPFKSGTTGASAVNTIVRSTGDTFAAGDIGRFIAIIPDVADSGLTQIRRITAVSGSTITVHDDWVGGAPASSTDWRISHNCQDVHDIGDPALEKIGDDSYRWDACWDVVSDGFFGDTDISLEMERSASVAWDVDAQCIVQFGVLLGGEANGSKETTNGCRLSFENTLSSTQNIYSLTNSKQNDGAVINYYGCLVEAKSTSAARWQFQRMRGPTRFIGCVFDGPIGGRFYHEESEWVDCRMSGLVSAVNAWSIGATFVRDIENITFFKNIAAVKNFSNFSGVFKSCIFTGSNDDILSINGSTTSTLQFVDCTTFADSDILDGGSGEFIQLKSTNYTMSDTSGIAIESVKVLIEDVNSLEQGIESSDVSGVVPEILSAFFVYTNNAPSLDKSPFLIIIRKYGFFFEEISTPLSDPIRQGVRLRTNTSVVLTEAAASALTGISVNVSGRIITLSSAKTVSELYDYTQWLSTEDVNMKFEPLITSTQAGSFDFGTTRIIIASGGTLSCDSDSSDGSIRFGDFGTLAVNAIQVQNGGTLEVGTATTKGRVIDFTDTLNDINEPWQETRANLYVFSGGTLNWHGGEIQTHRNIAWFGNINVDSVNCKLTNEGPQTFSGDYPQIRQRSNSTDISGMTAFGILLTLVNNPTKIENYVTSFVMNALTPSVSSPSNTFLTFKALDASDNVVNVAWMYAGKWLRFINLWDGTTATWNNVGTGVIEIRQEIEFSLTNGSEAKVYFKDTDNGSRLAANSVGLNPDYVSDREYELTESSGSAEYVTSGGVLSGVYYRTGASIIFDSRGNVNDTSDVITWLKVEYGQLLSTSNTTLKGTSKISAGILSLVDSFVVSTKAAASAITDISINSGTKEITVSAAKTKEDLYDYLKWYESENPSVIWDNGKSSIISTSDGNNYLLHADWTLILGVELSGGINLTGNVELSSVANLTDHNITGQLTFSIAGTYTITNSTISEVLNTSGGAIIINSVNSTFSLNTGPSITIDNSVSVSANVTDDVGAPIENAIVEISATATTGGATSGDIILVGLTDASGDISTTFNFLSDVPVKIKARQGNVQPFKVPLTSTGSIVSSGLSVSLSLQPDE